MTSDERFARIEHFTAGLAEQWKRDREEDRALWRDTQRQINQLARRMTEVEEQMLRYDERARELREEMAERDRKTDERIDKLVSAIGAFVSQRNGGEENKPG